MVWKGRERYFILRENSNEIKHEHTEMHGLGQGQTVSSFLRLRYSKM